jgi:exodeoxyribonuclease VII large subunit
MKKSPTAMPEDAPRQGNLFGSRPDPARLRPRAEEAPAPAPLAEPPRRAASPVQNSAPQPDRVIFTVGELTRDIKITLERGYPRVWVRGEVSGFRGPNARGHLYFSLKDAEACLDAKIWASTAQRMKFKLRDGLSVIAEGSIDLYEPQGRYSLIVQRIEPEGEGALALAFQQLKERLAAEGLFGERRLRPPRPIPFLPARIGIVTSVSGAALRDFLRVLHQRHPRIPVLLCDARVQGEGSAVEVVRALRRLARSGVDVIVLARGGGSIEDLWTFNEEVVARAIHACPVPVVTAIGHEVDFTIADFVADYRAPTPSAAAEKLAPVLRDLELSLRTTEGRLRKAAERQILADRQRLQQFRARLADPRRLLGQKQRHLSEQMDQMLRGLRQNVGGRRERLKSLQDRLSRQRPQARLARSRQELSKLSDRLRSSAWESLRRRRAQLHQARLAIANASPLHRVQDEHRKLLGWGSRLAQVQRRRAADERRRFHTLDARLDAMSPLKVMARGYAMVFRKQDRRIVRTVSQVQLGDELAIKLADADSTTMEECEEIDAQVTGIKPKSSSS